MRLAALLLAAVTATPTPPPPEFPKRLEIRGVPNAAQVSPVLYRGAQPTREGFVELQKLGVKTVLSMRSAHEDGPLMEGLGFWTFRIHSHQWHPETQDLVPALKLILTPVFQPVFVHCQAGKDRTGLVVAAYEILFMNRGVEEAIRERRAFGAVRLWEVNDRYLLGLKNAAVRAGLVKQVEKAPMPAVVFLK